MKGSLHMALGTVVGVSGAIVMSGSLFESTCFAGGVILGSLSPDVDNPKSKLGRRIPISAWICNVFLGHRGVLHSPAFMVVLYWLGAKVINTYGIGNYPFLIGFLLGYGLHLLQDMLTKGGIPLFFPITRKRFALGFAKSGSVFDDICTILLGALWLLMLYFDFANIQGIYGAIATWLYQA